MPSRACALLRDAGFPFAVPVDPTITPRDLYRWLQDHLPSTAASVMPYRAAAGDELAVFYVVGFCEAEAAECFTAAMSGSAVAATAMTRAA